MDKHTLATIIQEGSKIVSSLLNAYPLIKNSPSLPSVKSTQIKENGSTISTEDTIRYQRREISKELLLLEKHLQQGCKIDNKACDCCIVPGTKVYGNPTPVPIETPPEHVITHRGVVQPVSETFKREYHGELNELSVGYTSFPLLLTPEHPVLIAQNVRGSQRDIWRKKGISEDSLQWIPAEELTERDFMVFPRFREVKDREDISLQMAELLGWYVAEGSITGNRVTFSLSKDEIKNIARVKELIKNEFGVEPKSYEKPTVIHICYTQKGKTDIFREFGRGARQKRLPIWLLHLPIVKQKAFIMAAIAGDGSRQKYQIVYTTTSEILSYQIRLLLYRMGILHSLSVRAIGESFINGRKISPNGPRYDISIAGDAARSLDLSCGQRTSGNHGWISDNYAFLPIKCNRRIAYRGKVYNIAVDSDESYVTAHGCIHNCEKHPITIEALAQESLGMANDPVFKDVAKWSHSITSKTTQKASASGDYEDEYPRLAIKARELRKSVMGTDSVEALASDEGGQSDG